MHCTRMLTLKKASLSSTIKSIIDRQCIITNGIDFSTRPPFYQFCKYAHEKPISSNIIETSNKQGLFMKLLQKCGLFKGKYKSMAAGYLVYESIVDELNYSAFFKDFNMPDTFFSWFLVTELHVWMLMVRFMAEGEKGQMTRDYLVEAMWQNIKGRINVLGTIHPKIKKKQIHTIVCQFNAAMIGYDEGILSEDKVLAGALWRRFFCLECNNPEHLEKLLIYVRKQIYLLDKIPSHQMFHNLKIKWIDLKDIR
ncbi:ubiquinol-cytochrome c reductase complex assembly factor 1 isoform X1 [Ptiloglossa arizonensis]|uniref:ubiquinol-cytochrome c reductase complex assembly factor 1 isoform X1 n=2 Tax=Ptiloglossa arizonensis TaxID=3350558 RepID=UPI003FA0F744